ncbi:MAG: lysylphosphatidylglycerol synthase transmembrane domain-containing protein [Myxococcota bacterium]
MRRWPLVLIGPLVSIVALVLIVRRLDAEHLIDALRDLNAWWLVLIVPVYTSAHLVRGVRWQLMIYPVKPVRWRVTTSIVLVGLMANNLLPARLGELVRAFALRRSEQLGTAFALTSIVAERIFDGMALLVIFSITALVTPFPEELAGTLAGVGWAAAAVFLVAFAVVLLARLFPRLIERAARRATRWLPDRLGRRAEPIWRSGLAALAFLRADRTVLLFALLTLAIWLIEGGVLWLFTLVFGLDPDPRLAYFTLVLIGFGVALPSAPGYFGVFEAAVVLAFAAFGIAREMALSYALVVHALHFSVVGIGGLVALKVLGMSFGSLRQISRDAGSRNVTRDGP